MLIAIISAVVCLIISIVLFTPAFRGLLILRPVALFFIFEGIWIMVDYIITQIWPGIEAMQWVHYAGIIIFGGYLLICLFFSRPGKYKNRKKSRRQSIRASKRVSPDNRF